MAGGEALRPLGTAGDAVDERAQVERRGDVGEELLCAQRVDYRSQGAQACDAVDSWRWLRFWHFGMESWYVPGEEGCRGGESQPPSEYFRFSRPVGML